MNKVLKNGLLSLAVASLIAGCSSKDVEYDTSAQENRQTVQENQTQTDSKIDAIAGDETVVEGTMSSETTNDSEVSTLDRIKESGINITQSEIDGKIVSLQSVHFGFDKFNLNDQMREIASTNAQKIQNTSNDVASLKIKLEGNCDEWGTDEYNYALGLKRAKTAKDALIADGVNADSISLVSFGESNPICKDRTVSCWKLNRRVDYKLLP